MANSSYPKTAQQMVKVLQNREEHERDERIMKTADERYDRMNLRDVDSLCKKEKEEKLENFLKRKRQGNRRRKKHVTVSDVKAKAAKILEEFLRSQLEHSTKPSVGRYERYVEVDITEATSPSSEDNIPFADEDESDALLKKADSLPADHKEKYLGDSSDRLNVPIIHEKSKSAPDPSPLAHTENTQQYVPKRGKSVPPPPPPGTPHSVSGESVERVPYVAVPQTDVASNQSSDQSSSQTHSYDGYSLDTLDSYKHSSNKISDNDTAGQQGWGRHITPPRQPPESLDIIPHLIGNKPLHPLSEQSKIKSQDALSPQNQHRKLHEKSGSVSSSDTDERKNGTFHDRKKKSMFKKAQERLRSFLKIQSDKESPSDIPEENTDNFHNKPHRKHKKKKHHRQGMLEVAEDEMDVYEPPATGRVLEERCTHTNKHIGQHHSQWGGGLVRTEHTTQVLDITSPGERKHIEKHWNVKESSESGKGIMGRLRRMTSREKSTKKHVKGSKSLTFEQADKDKQYQRTISAPGHHGDRGQPEPTSETSLGQTVQLQDDGFTVTDIDRTFDGHREHITATQVVSRPEDIRRNSSCLDIVDHAGVLVEKIWFDPNEDLPHNGSFEFNLESCVHEAKVNKNGRIHTIQDVDMHKHLDTAEDLEMDGITEGSENDIDDMTEAERERLYGVIAERLAAIGDSYTSNKSESTTPTTKITVTARVDTSQTSTDEICRQHLNPLEKEISDTLREVAENIDEKLSENARQAALRIAGAVTYGQFKKSVGAAVGTEIGWNQVSALFNITKRAIQLAGASGALALQIKEMSLRYFEDTCAGWIVGQGGWDSMLEDMSTDSELD